MYRIVSLVTLVIIGLTSAAGAQEDLEALPIELPKPNYGSTPLDYSSPNYEKTEYAEREPFMAPKGASNVALNKPATASADVLTGKLAFVTDGNKEFEESNVVEIDGGFQYVQIDLGEPCHVYAILVWHFHAAERVYYDVVVQIAEDAAFTKGVQTLYNNDYDNTSKVGVGKDAEYLERDRGRLIDAKGATAQFVRLYTNGNTADDKNHYTEVEVWGKAAK